MAPLRLNDTQKKQLLKIARETLNAHLQGQATPAYSVSDPILLRQAAVFVTLWQRNGDLRGCVGQLQNLEALYKMVQSCAIAAAARDFRFSPVTAAELPGLIIEISVLSTPKKISNPEEIEIGKHGLIIEQNTPYPRRGLLLPEVAARRNWSRLQFLEAICQKAGLPPDAWRTADLYIFEAEVFSETS